MLRAILAAVVALSTAACSKGQEGGPAKEERSSHKPMDQAEADRGLALCDEHVARACACAESHPELPDLASACKQASARREALRMIMSVLSGSQGPISRREREENEAHARKTINSCMRADGALEPALCPRGRS